MISSFSVDSIDRYAYIVLLLDFYGSLLTEKQRQITDMYFMNDLSLAEIGEELGITRQAAGILINRTEKILRRYESRLGLVQKHAEGCKKAEKILNELKEIAQDEGIYPVQKAKIEKIIMDFPEEFLRGI